MCWDVNEVLLAYRVLQIKLRLPAILARCSGTACARLILYASWQSGAARKTAADRVIAQQYLGTCYLRVHAGCGKCRKHVTAGRADSRHCDRGHRFTNADRTGVGTH